MIIRPILLLSPFLFCCCVVVPLPFTSDKSPQFKGRVVDSNSKKPVAGAEVWAEGNERGKVATGPSGEFLLKPGKNFHLIFYANPSFGFGLPAGTRTEVLMIHADGYRPLVLDFKSPPVRDKYLAGEISEGHPLGPFHHQHFTLKPLAMERQGNAEQAARVPRSGSKPSR